MATEEIDAYLSTLEEPKQTTLRQLRTTILEIAPDAEQCISYGMPAFRLRGKLIAGFAAFKNHLSYLPHSGSVLSELDERRLGVQDLEGSPPVPDRRAASEGARREAHRRAGQPGISGLTLASPVLGRFVADEQGRDQDVPDRLTTPGGAGRRCASGAGSRAGARSPRREPRAASSARGPRCARSATCPRHGRPSRASGLRSGRSHQLLHTPMVLACTGGSSRAGWTRDSGGTLAR